MNSVFDLVWPAMLKPPSLRIEAVYCSPRSFVLDLSRQARRLTEELESAKNELQPLKELLSSMGSDQPSCLGFLGQALAFGRTPQEVNREIKKKSKGC